MSVFYSNKKKKEKVTSVFDSYVFHSRESKEKFENSKATGHLDSGSVLEMGFKVRHS
jgi:hypothetical protein